VKVVVTGATGLVGRVLVRELQAGEGQVTVLSRDPVRAREALGAVSAERWDPLREPAPAQALAGADAVVHLLGAPVSQRWTAAAKRAIRDSRVEGTRNLIAGLEALVDDDRPVALIGSSAVGYYGAHGEEPLDEEAPAGRDYLAQVCVEWEAQERVAARLGMRVVSMRTGVVLAGGGGALGKMLPPFRLGVGGPVAGGRQYVSWVHVDDLVGLYLTALRADGWHGPINATAPTPVSNRELARALGKVLHRPALVPMPAAGLRLLYGEMARIVTEGARVLPAKALVLGYRFRYAQLEEALRAVLS
jgi:uncharacterized protein (TIGR01777 family)